MIRPTTLALALVLLTTACTRSTEASPATVTPAPELAGAPAAAAATPPVGASDPAAGATAPAAGPSSPPSGPIPLPITSAVAVGATAPAPLVYDQPTTVDPAVQFQVEVAAPLVDARLALVDSSDAFIAAAESHEIGATWSRFSLAPDAPLRPGSTYSLRLDGAADREAHDADGRAYQITVWEIRTSGEPPPPEPAPKKKRR